MVDNLQILLLQNFHILKLNVQIYPDGLVDGVQQLKELVLGLYDLLTRHIFLDQAVVNVGHESALKKIELYRPEQCPVLLSQLIEKFLIVPQCLMYLWLRVIEHSP